MHLSCTFQNPEIDYLKMNISIPTTLKTLSTSGSAAKSITAWWKRAKGDSRALIGELKDNMLYLDMVATGDVKLEAVVDKLSTTEYKRLSREGFNFNQLKRSKISHYESLRRTDLASWGGKETAELIDAIYEKINEIIIKFPHVGNHKNYRWGVRVNNIRKRLWLLLKHVGK